MIASKSYGFIVVCKLLCVVDKKNPDFIEALFKITAHNIPVTMIATTVTEIYFLSMIVAWVNDTPPCSKRMPIERMLCGLIDWLD